MMSALIELLAVIDALDAKVTEQILRAKAAEVERDALQESLTEAMDALAAAEATSKRLRIALDPLCIDLAYLEQASDMPWRDSHPIDVYITVGDIRRALEAGAGVWAGAAPEQASEDEDDDRKGCWGCSCSGDPDATHDCGLSQVCRHVPIAQVGASEDGGTEDD